MKLLLIVVKSSKALLPEFIKEIDNDCDFITGYNFFF